MDALRLETLSQRPADAGQKARQHAEKVADQFETIFVRSMVQSMRLSATYGGDSGMFGSGPGADTYSDWFDQNVAEHVSASSQVGIAKQLMRDFERSGEIPRLDPETRAGKQLTASLTEAFDRSKIVAAHASDKGGIHVAR
jgi:Rod binding domain-containing protein